MKLFITKNKNAGNKEAFKLVKDQIKTKRSSLLALAAGETTDGLYKLISKDAKRNPEKWRKIKLFQIDEKLDISPEDPLSFNFELRKELKDLLKIIEPKNIFLINGDQSPKKTIKEAHKFIKKNKGLDLIILGIGPIHDPHIAYNTSGTSTLKSKFRVVKLHPQVAKKAKVRYGLTIGIKEILESKKVLLIAYGKSKTMPIWLALKNKIDVKNVPASALQLHKNLYVVIDTEASKNLNIK